ncbi:MAG: low specificity L-threonine aldolase, partial [Actinobacteria bacterium]
MAFPDGTADFRSDTVTRPTQRMLEAMASAPVGDDVYHDDPTVNLLEEESAAVAGKEAAIFVPTGTMGNQLAIMLHTNPGEEILANEA